MPAKSAWWSGIVIAAVLVIAGCGEAIDGDVNDPAPELISTPATEPAPGETPESEPPDPPPEPQPTQVPSGSFLQIDGVKVRQVVLWDAELPAEFAATRFTLYHREDSRSWSRVGSLPTEGRIIADPSDPEMLYLGDHPPCLREGEPIPFHRSVDGGRTWEELPDAANTRPIMVLAEDPATIIGSRCGLAISRDRGESWDRHLPDSEFDLTRLTATQVGLYGIFTSQDQHSYLRRIDLEDPDNPEFQEPILTFWGRGVVHATRERILVGEPSGVHLTDDGGRTWNFTREGLEDVVTSVNPLEEPIPDAELEAGIGISALLPDPEDSARIFLGTIRGLYLSEDSGQSWGKIEEVGDYEVIQLNFALGDAVLYATTTEGVIILHNP